MNIGYYDKLLTFLNYDVEKLIIDNILAKGEELGVTFPNSLVRFYYYFGNCNGGGESNYQACIITAQNALKDYPYSNLREEFSLLLMKSKFELAENSVDAKRLERYQDAEDECYGFINEYPDSKDRDTAEKFIKKCKHYTDKLPTIE